MGRSATALSTVVLLLAALVSVAVEVHSTTHLERQAGLVSVAYSATHAAEKDHMESAGAMGDILCPACVAPLQKNAGPLSLRAETAAQVPLPFRHGAHDALPLIGGRVSTVPRAPPRFPA